MGFGTEAGHAERVEVLVHRVCRIRDIRNARVTKTGWESQEDAARCAKRRGWSRVFCFPLLGGTCFRLGVWY